MFLRLAALVRPAAVVEKRWGEMLDAEAGIIRRQAPGPGIHSGVPA